MQPLFQFNSSAIDDIGVSDINERISTLLSEIEHEVRTALEEQAPGEHFDLSWQDDNIVVTLNAEQTEREYGNGKVSMRPTARTALTKATESLRSKLVIRV